MRQFDMGKASSFPLLLFVVILGFGAAIAYAQHRASGNMAAVAVLGAAFLVAPSAASSLQIADQWNKAVFLRLGKFRALRGPGLFAIIPLIDPIPCWVDTRVLTSSFKAEKTLSKDTVPADVDAVLFWKIVAPRKAALDVADYPSAIGWAAQTALRDVTGKSMPAAELPEGRDKIAGVPRTIIDERTELWGIRVISAEVRDVLTPLVLQNAMSAQAQAERERQARIILRDSERQVAEKCVAAARNYAGDPVAFHLRGMNMLYEALKQNSTIVMAPSSAIETMQLGGLTGLKVLSMGLARDRGNRATLDAAAAVPGPERAGAAVNNRSASLPAGVVHDGL